MHIYSSCTRNGDLLNLLINTSNVHKEKILQRTIINTFKNHEEEDWNPIKNDNSGRMAFFFTIVEIKYLIVSLFCDLAPHHSYSYLRCKVPWLLYLPCFRHSDKSGYGFLKVIHHILARTSLAQSFSNKMFSLNSVLQIVRFMNSFWFFLNLGFITLLYSINIDNRKHISKRNNPYFTVYVGAARRAPSVTSALRVSV